MGYDVTDVADGDRAWEVFLAQGGNFDVVFFYSHVDILSGIRFNIVAKIALNVKAKHARTNVHVAGPL